jgi:hypothetical protein
MSEKARPCITPAVNFVHHAVERGGKVWDSASKAAQLYKRHDLPASAYEHPLRHKIFTSLGILTLALAYEGKRATFAQSHGMSVSSLPGGLDGKLGQILACSGDSNGNNNNSSGGGGGGGGGGGYDPRNPRLAPARVPVRY